MTRGSHPRMSAPACHTPNSWSVVPHDRVVRVRGLSPEELAVALDPLPPDAPVVIRYQPPSVAPSISAVVDEVLDRLEVIARQLFPAWLPDAHLVDTTSDLDRRVVRTLAHRRALGSEHFGPFLADLAEAALLGRPVDRRFPPELRARGMLRVLREAYRRDGVVLMIESTAEPAADEQRLTTVCEWLANHGGFGVWLIGDTQSSNDRFPTATLQLRPPLATPVRGVDHAVPPPIEFPPLAGRPHPASLAEQTLERCLTQCEWATGRIWNQVHSRQVDGALATPMRVDLMWLDERCVVEIDGPDHRGGLKYADDRRRDNALVLDGFAVLRFTNEEIVDDPRRVLAVIEELLSARRNEGTPR
jgi:very-short-patch-repair endonuclease